MEDCVRTVKAAGIQIAPLEGNSMENLYSLINIEPDKKEMVCLIGAGGKTSLMFRLARELSSKGKKVLATTTTAIYYPESSQYDHILISEKETGDLFYDLDSGGVTVLGRSVSQENKLLGVSPDFLDSMFHESVFDFIIVEGDGSKKRPIKAPAEHEPVIPSHASKVLGIVGLDCIGKRVSSENVHRPELFCRIIGCREGDIVDADMISNLTVHKNGLFKGAPNCAERYLVLNKADRERARLAASYIAGKLAGMDNQPDGVIISSIKNPSFWSTA